MTFRNLTYIMRVIWSMRNSSYDRFLIARTDERVTTVRQNKAARPHLCCGSIYSIWVNTPNKRWKIPVSSQMEIHGRRQQNSKACRQNESMPL